MFVDMHLVEPHQHSMGPPETAQHSAQQDWHTPACSTAAASPGQSQRLQLPADAPNGKGKNTETAPFFNSVTADLTPTSQSRVDVQFKQFKIFGLLPVTAPASAKGWLDTTYLDEEMRISRGDKGGPCSFIDSLFSLFWGLADPSDLLLPYVEGGCCLLGVHLCSCDMPADTAAQQVQLADAQGTMPG